MRVERYREASAAVLAVLQRWGAPVEKTSYDDFYVDVTQLVGSAGADDGGGGGGGDYYDAIHGVHGADGGLELQPDLLRASAIGEAMRAALREAPGVAVSCGVGRSKLVARMASPEAKPDGLRAVADHEVAAFMARQRLRARLAAVWRAKYGSGMGGAFAAVCNLAAVGAALLSEGIAVWVVGREDGASRVWKRWRVGCPEGVAVGVVAWLEARQHAVRLVGSADEAALGL